MSPLRTFDLILIVHAQAVMSLTDEQKRGIQAAWRVCMSQSKRVLQQRELALAELDMRGLSLQREGDFSLEMRKVLGLAYPILRTVRAQFNVLCCLVAPARCVAAVASKFIVAGCRNRVTSCCALFCAARRCGRRLAAMLGPGQHHHGASAPTP